MQSLQFTHRIQYNKHNDLYFTFSLLIIHVPFPPNILAISILIYYASDSPQRQMSIKRHKNIFGLSL